VSTTLPKIDLPPEATDSNRVLLYGVLCPFSRQICLGLWEKNVAFLLREERTWNPSDGLYALNLEGTLPVLIDRQHPIIGVQSQIEYLEEAFPSVSLLGTQSLARAEVRRLIDWFNRKFFHDVTQAFVYERVFKGKMGHGSPDSAVLTQGRRRIHDHLDYIGWLFEGRRWLAGDALSWADIVAACHLSCVDYLGEVPWSKHPGAQDWYMKIKSRPHFRPFLHEVFSDLPPCRHYKLLDF